MTRRRRWLGVGVLVVLLLTSLAGAWVWFAVRQPPGTWQRLDPPPVRPATNALLAWTGRELIVAGGDVEPPCPPGNRGGDFCLGTGSGDSAAYVPEDDAWRSIGGLPGRTYAATPHAVVAGALYVGTGAGLAVLEPGSREWEMVDRPGATWRHVIAMESAGQRLSVVFDQGDSRRDRIWSLDVKNSRWALLSKAARWPGEPRATFSLRPPDAPDEGTSIVWAEGLLYAFGGVDRSGESGATPTDAFWRFRPEWKA